MFLAEYFYLTGAIRRRNDCHIEFLPPAGFTSTRCRSNTDRCNQTGLWQNYDFHIETACLSYESVFMFDGGVYRNVHCYLCNNMESSLPLLCPKTGDEYVPVDPPVYRLTHLLNFREGPPTDTSCPIGDLSFVNNKQVVINFTFCSNEQPKSFLLLAIYNVPMFVTLIGTLVYLTK